MRKNKKIGSGILVAVMATIIWASNAAAFYQPDYQNRVVTNFLDGALPPMAVLHAVFYNYDSSDLRIGSQKAPGEFDLSVNVNLNQFIYISEKKWGWAHPGFEVIVPYVDGDFTDPAGNSDSDSGMADIFAAFMWQSDPTKLSLGNTEFPFFWRIVAGIWMPAGEYEHDKLFNVGCNIFTFHTYFANTIFLTPKWTLSSRWQYYLHTENDEFGPGKDDLKPGQLFNLNFSTAYEIIPGVRLGLLGHYWYQVTDDELNGRDFKGDLANGIPGGKERLFAWGPGLFLSKPIKEKNLFFEAHASFDSYAKNRPQGTTILVRAGLMF